MRKIFAFLSALLLFLLVFAGCSKKAKEVASIPGAMRDISETAQVTEKLQEAYQKGDQEAGVKMMEEYAKLGAKFELKEFEQMEAVDAPEGFPKELIYKDGKVTEASDDSSDTYLNKSVTIKTTAEVKDVKDFYKGLLSAAPWKISSQSSESYGASFNAKNSSTKLEAEVSISADPYSKITQINVYYSGDK